MPAPANSELRYSAVPGVQLAMLAAKNSDKANFMGFLASSGSVR